MANYQEFLKSLSDWWIQALYADNQSLAHQDKDKLHFLELEATQRGLKLIGYANWRGIC